MKTLNWQHRVMMIIGLLAAPILTNGCSGASVDGGADDCVVGGCSGQSCVEPGGDGLISTCEWLEEYACYKDHGVCERNASNQCGWKPSQALQDCIDVARNPMSNRMPVSGACIRNATDACTTDADCKTGGCGGELCEGTAGQGITTCECTGPQGISCGCVNGTCSWWQ